MSTVHQIGVLVVDDDFRVAALHADFVDGTEGFTVLGTAHDARATLEAAARLTPDLVLLDLYLPDQHGLTVLSKLREGDGPYPDVIVITAAQDLPSIRTAMQRGVVHYLVKPFAFRALAERLSAYRTMWAQTQSSGGVVPQRDIDQLFRVMGNAESAPLPKGHSEPTRMLVRAEFEDLNADWSAAEVAERVGVSRATAQRYLTLLERDGTLRLHLRYGSTGRPEHRYTARATRRGHI